VQAAGAARSEAGEGTAMSYSIEDAAQLLRRFQLAERALDRRITKKAAKDQRRIVKELTEIIVGRKVNDEEVDRIVATMN
jgi:hypothetical protein